MRVKWSRHCVCCRYGKDRLLRLPLGRGGGRLGQADQSTERRMWPTWSAGFAERGKANVKSTDTLAASLITAFLMIFGIAMDLEWSAC